MEDLTLALVTLTSFVLLFVVAIFADRAGADLDVPMADSLHSATPVPAPVAVLDDAGPLAPSDRVA